MPTSTRTLHLSFLYSKDDNVFLCLFLPRLFNITLKWDLHEIWTYDCHHFTLGLSREKNKGYSGIIQLSGIARSKSYWQKSFELIFFFFHAWDFLSLEYPSLDISSTGWVLKCSENSHHLLQKMLMGENEYKCFIIKRLWLAGKGTYKPKKGSGKLMYQSRF